MSLINILLLLIVAHFSLNFAQDGDMYSSSSIGSPVISKHTTTPKESNLLNYTSTAISENAAEETKFELPVSIVITIEVNNFNSPSPSATEKYSEHRLTNATSIVSGSPRALLYFENFSTSNYVEIIENTTLNSVPTKIVEIDPVEIKATSWSTFPTVTENSRRESVFPVSTNTSRSNSLAARSTPLKIELISTTHNYGEYFTPTERESRTTGKPSHLTTAKPPENNIRSITTAQPAASENVLNFTVTRVTAMPRATSIDNNTTHSSITALPSSTKMYDERTMTITDISFSRNTAEAEISTTKASVYQSPAIGRSTSTTNYGTSTTTTQPKSSRTTTDISSTKTTSPPSSTSTANIDNHSTITGRSTSTTNYGTRTTTTQPRSSRTTADISSNKTTSPPSSTSTANNDDHSTITGRSTSATNYGTHSTTTQPSSSRTTADASSSKATSPPSSTLTANNDDHSTITGRSTSTRNYGTRATTTQASSSQTNADTSSSKATSLPSSTSTIKSVSQSTTTGGSTATPNYGTRTTTTQPRSSQTTAGASSSKATSPPSSTSTKNSVGQSTTTGGSTATTNFGTTTTSAQPSSSRTTANISSTIATSPPSSTPTNNVGKSTTTGRSSSTTNHGTSTITGQPSSSITTSNIPSTKATSPPSSTSTTNTAGESTTTGRSTSTTNCDTRTTTTKEESPSQNTVSIFTNKGTSPPRSTPTSNSVAESTTTRRSTSTTNYGAPSKSPTEHTSSDNFVISSTFKARTQPNSSSITNRSNQYNSTSQPAVAQSFTTENYRVDSSYTATPPSVENMVNRFTSKAKPNTRHNTVLTESSTKPGPHARVTTISKVSYSEATYSEAAERSSLEHISKKNHIKDLYETEIINSVTTQIFNSKEILKVPIFLPDEAGLIFIKPSNKYFHKMAPEVFIRGDLHITVTGSIEFVQRHNKIKATQIQLDVDVSYDQTQNRHRLFSDNGSEGDEQFKTTFKFRCDLKYRHCLKINQIIIGGNILAEAEIERLDDYPIKKSLQTGDPSENSKSPVFIYFLAIICALIIISVPGFLLIRRWSRRAEYERIE